MQTSGTTGPAKRVALLRQQLEAALAGAQEHNDRSQFRDKAPFTGAVGLVVIPIVHIGGLWSLLQALVAARPIVMLTRFTLSAWRAVVVEHQPVLVSLPPPALRAILDSDVPQHELASVRVIVAGSAPVENSVVDAFLQRYQIPVLTTYGATEFGGAVAGWSPRDFRALWTAKKGSVGRAFPGVDLRVVDRDGAQVTGRETGRLQVRSAQAGNNNQWVMTHDLVHIDEDGFVFIDGRADDVIVRGGFKIDPEAVVRALRAHEAVIDAAVIGVNDDRLGQVPVAAVELQAGATTTEQVLREHSRKVLAPYEVPTRIFVVNELPRGAALKVDRRRLIALLEDLKQVG